MASVNCSYRGDLLPTEEKDFEKSELLSKGTLRVEGRKGEVSEAKEAREREKKKTFRFPL